MSQNYNPLMNQASARNFNRMTTAMATPTNVYKVNNLSDDERKVVNTSNYPVQLGSDDPEDRKFALQQKLVGAGGVVEGVGVAQAGSDYFNYVTRKEEMVEEVEYREWLMKQAVFDSPEKTKYWFDMFPWIKELKEQEINRVAQLQLQQARINLVGPQNPQDWALQWNIKRGIVEIPNQPVHMLPKSTDYDRNDFYTRGMFSPMTQYIPPFKNATEGPNFKYQYTDPEDTSKSAGGKMLQVPNDIKLYGRAPK